MSSDRVVQAGLDDDDAQYEAGLRPRNLDELSVTLKRKKLQFFSPKDIQKLFDSLGKDLPVQWENRNNEQTDY